MPTVNPDVPLRPLESDPAEVKSGLFDRVPIRSLRISDRVKHALSLREIDTVADLREAYASNPDVLENLGFSRQDRNALICLLY